MDNDIAGFTAKYITTSSSQLANIKTLLGKLSTAGRSDVSTSFSQSYWASSEVYCPSESIAMHTISISRRGIHILIATIILGHVILAQLRNLTHITFVSAPSAPSDRNNLNIL
jgi:hypothetical protein